VTAPDFPPFRPRFPWITADLQTVRNYLIEDGPSLARFRSERIEFPLSDSDRLVATLNWPERERQRPLVWLIHGLTGSRDSLYLRRAAEHLLEQGYPTLRLNLRGAGLSAPLCRFSYHAGRSEDLEQAVRRLDDRLAGAGMFAVGFSLGGNMLLKHLGEQRTATRFIGAVSVSAPILPKAAQVRIMRRRNFLYHRPGAARSPAARTERLRIRRTVRGARQRLCRRG
jgi:predicted alpha/beta-fold hydrolase